MKVKYIYCLTKTLFLPTSQQLQNVLMKTFQDAVYEPTERTTMWKFFKYSVNFLCFFLLFAFSNYFHIRIYNTDFYIKILCIWIIIFSIQRLEIFERSIGWEKVERSRESSFSWNRKSLAFVPFMFSYWKLQVGTSA
jgi:hypothetical protein